MLQDYSTINQLMTPLPSAVNLEGEDSQDLVLLV
jgi:hypothetical protein